jgi:hypothetical protein
MLDLFKNKFLNAIISKVINKNLGEVEICEKGVLIRSSGFYCCEEVILVENDVPDLITVIQRYGEKTDICNFGDLVGISYYWWEVSKDRYDGWDEMDTDWGEYYSLFGYMNEIKHEEQDSDDEDFSFWKLLKTLYAA